MERDTLIHLISGGVAGTAGAVVTCPLEVVKTRLQSSNPVFGNPNAERGTGGGGGSSNGSRGNKSSLPPHQRHYHYHTTERRGITKPSRFISTCVNCGRNSQLLAVARSIPPNPMSASTVTVPKLGLLQCLRLIVEKEGPRALFKGLGPNIVGVAPSRAIYFCSYSQSKKTFNQIFPADSPIVHICSAATAGFTSSSLTAPVWMLKTRLQLDQSRSQSISETIRKIYRQGGILGFYKGITASYMGISETVIHFVIYEAIKKRLNQWSRSNETLADAERNPEEKTTKDFMQFMVAGAVSKTVASIVAYPHEVARTRLREEGSKYRKFWQTISLVANEEGWRGLYRGLGTQLIRQIPNTAIMMSTYEATVYLFTKYLPKQNTGSMSNADFINQDDGCCDFEIEAEGINHARQ